MGWKNLKYQCPRCRGKLNIRGRYPGDFICAKCGREWQLTIEGLWGLERPWQDDTWREGDIK